MKEGFEQRDPEELGRFNVVMAAVQRFEEMALREHGTLLTADQQPAPVTNAVDAGTLAQLAAEQSMAAISTQQAVSIEGPDGYVLAA